MSREQASTFDTNPQEAEIVRAAREADNYVVSTDLLQIDRDKSSSMIISPEAEELLGGTSGNVNSHLLEELDSGLRDARAIINARPDLEKPLEIELNTGETLRLIGSGGQSAVFYFKYKGDDYILKQTNLSAATRDKPVNKVDYRKVMLWDQTAQAELAPRMFDEQTNTQIEFSTPLIATETTAIFKYAEGRTPNPGEIVRLAYPMFVLSEKFIEDKTLNNYRVWDNTRTDVIGHDYCLKNDNFKMSDLGNKRKLTWVDAFVHSYSGSTPLYFEDANLNRRGEILDSNYTFTQMADGYAKIVPRARKLEALLVKKNEVAVDWEKQFYNLTSEILSFNTDGQDTKALLLMCKQQLLRQEGLTYLPRITNLPRVQ